MKAGLLDRRVTLLQPQAEVDDGYTTQPSGWASAGTRKARYMPARPREIFENAGREAEMPVIWELRFDTLTRQIDATWKLSYDGKTYDVQGAEEIGRREGVRLVTVAGDDVEIIEPVGTGALDFTDPNNSGLLALFMEAA